MKAIELTYSSAGERVLREGREEDVLVLENGRPVAMMVAFDEDDVAWYARENDPEFIRSIARAREQVGDGQTITHEQLKKELGL